MQPTDRRVLGTACAAHGTIHVYELAVPALLLPIQAAYGAGDLGMGRVVTLYGLLFGLGALPAGLLVDRWGSRRLLLACIWGSAVCVASMAVSPTLPAFAVSAALMGLCLSIYHPAGTALISQLLPNTGKTFAYHGMAGNLGVAGAGLIAGVLGDLLGWRAALGTLAAAGLALGVLVLRLPAPRREDVPLAATGRPAGAWAGFALLLAAAGFMGMVYRGMTTFLPKLFSLTYAGEGESAGRLALGGGLTTATLIVGLVGMFVAGKLLDRGWGAVTVFGIGAVAQAPFLVLMGAGAAGTLLPLAAGVAFFHFMTQPAGNQLVAKLTPPSLRGAGYGLYFFLVFGVGAVGATIGGWISETEGLARIFPVLAALLAPALVATLLLGRNRRRAGPDPT